MHTKSNDTLTETVCTIEPALRAVDPLQVYNATVMYLFRGLNQKGYAARLRRLLGKQGPVVNIKQLSEKLNGDGYIVKNLKVWMFFVMKNRLDSDTAKEYAKKWGIKPRDFYALPVMSRATVGYLSKLGRKYVAVTLEAMDRNVVRITQEVNVWLGKFISKKHRFIIQSQGFHRKDVENEMIYHGIRGLFNQYPLIETKLHATNVVKRVIHNQGINYIHKYTTQKNGRLTTEADGSHQARVIELNDVQMNTMVAPEPVTDLTHDVNIYMQRLQGKKREFLQLLCGGYSEPFTAWLQQQGHAVDTNEDLAERTKSDKYMKLVLGYLQVKVESGQKFVRRLQTMFKDYTARALDNWTALVEG